jgi:hypothetical protein
MIGKAHCYEIETIQSGHGFYALGNMELLLIKVKLKIPCRWYA